LREIEGLEKTKKNEIEIQQIRNDLNTYRDIIHETNDVIIELESALVKVHLAERLGCSTTDLKEEIIACPASKMSRVIGKNGSNISQIERKTQVQIEVGDITSGEVGRIRIVGTEHGIVEAIKEIENVTLAIEEEMLVSSALSSYLAAKVRKGHMTHNAIEPSLLFMLSTLFHVVFLSISLFY
jgi:predicted PilT family ATPase